MAVIQGTALDDTLNGTSGDDFIFGFAGNDFISGGTGRDLMYGGTGDDTYVVNSSLDEVFENSGEGNDTVNSSVGFTLPANVENLTLQGGAAINGSGNELDNVIIGNNADNSINGLVGDDTIQGLGGNDTLFGGTGADTVLGGDGDDIIFGSFGNDGVDTLNGGNGNDILSGGTGVDSLIGGFGDDTFVVVDAANVLLEKPGSGKDLVLARVDFTLPSNVEDGRIDIITGHRLTGNDLANTLTGGQGDDTLDGGTGVDQLAGARGNDTYFVDDAGDVVAEFAGHGVDRVNASVSYTLGAGQEIEVLQLVGAGDIDATGNELANTVNGNNGANDLFGRGGNDSLFGSGGDDFFHFATGDGVDTVADFTGAGIQGGDVIQLGGTGLTSFAQVLSLMSDIVGGSQIVFNASDTLIISGVAKAQFDAGDFGFV